MTRLCLIIVVAAISCADLAIARSIATPMLRSRWGALLETELVGNEAADKASPEAAKPEGEKPSRKPEIKQESDGSWSITTYKVEKLWPGKSSISLGAQYFFACAWIAMIASLPFIIPAMDQKVVTVTQQITGASMLTILFGGLYLFTNVIMFESVHFDQVRPLTIVECIYFMSQVITTVGYGDIVPAKPRGQVFVALYVLGALFVIGMIVSQVIEHCTALLHQKRETLWGATPRNDRGRTLGSRGRYSSVGASPRNDDSRPVFRVNKEDRATLHDLLHPERPSVQNLVWSIATFAVIDFIWVVFFSTFPGENKTVGEAFYMALITMSTVGLGAFTPVTEEGMIFNAFFMILGSASMVNVIGQFCDFVAQLNEFQRFDSDSKKNAIEVLKRTMAKGDKVTELEFFKFIVLYDEVMTEGEVEGILQVFGDLKPDDGAVEFSSVEQAMEIERSRSKYFEAGVF